MKESEYVTWAKQFATCQKLFDRLAVKKSGSKATERRYAHSLFDFYNFSGLTPDQFVEEWRKASKEDLEQALEDFDVKLDMFVKWLKEKRGIKRGGLVTAHAAVKSLIKYNCRIKLAIGTPSAGVPESLEPLTIDEVKRLDAAGNFQQKWIIRGLKDSGMSREDFADLTYSDIMKEFETGEQYIHLSVVRQKEQVKYETFLGPNAVKALRDYIEWRRRKGEKITANSPLTATYRKPYTKIRPDVITTFLNRLGKQIGIPASPHRLRKTFETYMALDVKHPIILKYWMGHKLEMSDIEKRYVIPPKPEQKRLYQQAYKNLDIEQVSMEERLKAIEEIMEGLTPDQRELMQKHGIILREKKKAKKKTPETATNGGFPMNCTGKQQIVSEEELPNHLNHGWRVAAVLHNGKVVIERNNY